MFFSRKEKKIQIALGLQKSPEEIRDVVEAFRKKEEEKEREYELDRTRDHDNWDALDRLHDTLIANDLCVASIKDYKKWLEGYLSNGGEITHSYNYPFGRWEWFVAKSPVIEVPPLCGASKLDIIVPVGIEARALFPKKGMGHVGLYFMDGFKKNAATVPIFSDVIF